MVELRKNQRFDTREKCLLRHESTVGNVIDLSLGGLSCSCCLSDCDDALVRNCEHVDIFCDENKMWVRELKVDILESKMIRGQFFNGFWMRKCRARFGRLRDEQAHRLEELIFSFASR